MRTLSTLLSAAGFAALVGFAGTGPAATAPLGTAKAALDGGAGQVQTVDYRGATRHCHWRNGRKWCHGGASRYYDGHRYGYRPGVYLRFGFGGDRYRHNRRYWR